MTADRVVAPRCPSCAAGLEVPPPRRCRSCGVFLAGDTARRLSRLDGRLAGLTAERRDLLIRLRREAAMRDRPATRDGDRRATVESGDAPAPQAHARLPGWFADAGPQTLLAAGGVLLLAIAAVIFTAVAWRDLPLVARGAVLVVASGASARLTFALVRRGLRRTAEATSVLTVVVPTVLAHALWRAGLLDWLGPDAAALALTTGLLALGGHALARATTVRAPLVLAAAFAAVACLAGGEWATDLLPAGGVTPLEPVVLISATLVAAVLAGTYARQVLVVLPGWRVAVLGAAAVLWLGAVVAAAVQLADLAPAVQEDRVPYIAAMVLVGAAVAAAISARRIGPPHRAVWVATGSAGAWFAATVGGIGALSDKVSGWPELAVVVPFAVAVAALAWSHDAVARRGALVGMVPITLAALVPVAETIRWLGGVVDQRLAAPWPDVVTLSAPPAPATMASALVVTAVGVAALRVARRWTSAALLAAWVGGPLVLAVGVRIWPVGGGAAMGLIGVAVAVAGVRRAPGGTAPVALPIAVVATASTALTTPAVTIVTLASAAAITGRALPIRGRPSSAISAFVLAANLIGLAAAIAAAVTRQPGPVGIAVAGSAAGALLATVLLRERTDDAFGVEAAAGVAFGIAVAAAAAQGPVWLATALAVLAVAAAAIATWRADRRWMRWVATGAATMCWWVLLDSRGVEVAEAYTVPPALLIIALGVAGLRASPVSSWQVLAPGLALLTLPSVRQLVDDPDDLMRLAVVVALGAVLAAAGRAWALQSPLVIGVAVSAIAALTQHAVVTAFVPRWMLLAVGGSLLLWSSITYEQQVARLSTAQRLLAAMR